MVISPDAHPFKPVAVGVGAGLSIVMGDDDRIDQEASGLEFSPEPENVHVIGDSKVAADLALLYVDCADDNDYLAAVAQGFEHMELAVGLESRQHPACVIIIE